MTASMSEASEIASTVRTSAPWTEAMFFRGVLYRVGNGHKLRPGVRTYCSRMHFAYTTCAEQAKTNTSSGNHGGSRVSRHLVFHCD